MKKAWKIFDKNGDGKLTPQEFRYNMNAASKIDFDDYDSGYDDKGSPPQIHAGGIWALPVRVGGS